MLGESNETNIGTLHLEKPLMNASGTLSKENLDEVKDVYGALVTKTVTLEPRIGNPPPRIAEVSGGIINNIGLQNVGLDEFLEEELDVWAAVGRPVIVSIFATNQDELGKLCKPLNRDARVAAIELNLSCPNAAHLSETALALGLCRYYLSDKPLIAKLPYEDALRKAHLAARWDVNALTLINSIPGYTGPPRASKPLLGGYSGPGIKPIALRAVHDVAQEVDLSIIGCGGITCEEDIEEFMRAGASCVQIGSGSFARDSAEIVPTKMRRKRRR